jgi:hypothetical protein
MLHAKVTIQKKMYEIIQLKYMGILFILIINMIIALMCQNLNIIMINNHKNKLGLNGFNINQVIISNNSTAFDLELSPLKRNVNL